MEIKSIQYLSTLVEGSCRSQRALIMPTLLLSISSSINGSFSASQLQLILIHSPPLVACCSPFPFCFSREQRVRESERERDWILIIIKATAGGISSIQCGWAPLPVNVDTQLALLIYWLVRSTNLYIKEEKKKTISLLKLTIIGSLLGSDSRYDWFAWLLFFCLLGPKWACS